MSNYFIIIIFQYIIIIITLGKAQPTFNHINIIHYKSHKPYFKIHLQD